MQSIITSLRSVGFLTIALTLALAANFAYGQWANPTTTAPGGNVAAPVNISSANQIKTGNITAWRQKAGDQMWSPWYCSEIGPGADTIPGTADDFCAKMEDVRALIDGGLPESTSAPESEPVGGDFTEVTFDTSGEHTFVVPSGVTRIEIEERGPASTVSSRTISKREVYAYARASSPAYMRDGTQSAYSGSLRNFQPLYQAANSIKSHLSSAAGSSWTTIGWRPAYMTANFDANGNSGSPYLVSVNFVEGSTQMSTGNTRRKIRNVRFDDSQVDISASANITNPKSWPAYYSSQSDYFSSNELSWYANFDELIESTTSHGSNTVTDGGISVNFSGSVSPQIQTNQYNVTEGDRLTITITNPVRSGYVTIRNASN